MVQQLRPFHLAIPVNDLDAADRFYGDVMGCARGRRSPDWIDYNFFGHQLVAHLCVAACGPDHGNVVDGETVPVRHFGVVLDRDQWTTLADRLRAADIDFLIAPGVRFAGAPGEQGTFFVRDPAGNALEFKYFDDIGQLFAV